MGNPRHAHKGRSSLSRDVILLCNVEGIESLPLFLITNVSNSFPGSKTYGYIKYSVIQFFSGIFLI
jgi:hypothetical protein